MTEGRRKLNNSAALAGFHETQGEKVLQALKKVYEKLHRLENDRLMSKQIVDSMATQTDDPSAAAEFLQRLATAEARCQLLEVQLTHIKDMITDINVDNMDNKSVNSSIASDTQETNLQKAKLCELPPVGLFLQHLREQAKHTRVQTPELLTPQAGLIPPKQTKDVGSYIRSTQRKSLAVPSIENWRQATENSSNAFYKSGITSLHKRGGSFDLNDAAFHEKFIQSDSSMELLGATNRRSPAETEQVRKRNTPSRSTRTRRKETIKPLNISLESEATAISEPPVAGTPGRGRSRHSSRRDDRYRDGERRESSRSRAINTRKANSASQPTGHGNKATLSHYHVNVSGMPFVTGTSTAKSHSLRANIQTLYSMVKYCNPALCSAAPLHRQRSSSLDRQPQKRVGGLSRWNSASDMRYRKQRCRSCSADNYTRVPNASNRHKDIFSDLDTIPVKLSPKHLSNGGHMHMDHCDKHVCDCNTPGKVCIKTELKSEAEGQHKILEVKMSTPASPRSARLLSKEELPENERRKQLLQDLRNLHYYLQQD